MNPSRFRYPAIAILAGLLGACATVPKPLQGQFQTTTPRQAVNGGSGESVRWGGEIIKVQPKADATCFEILGRELDDSARPRLRRPADGRFIACRNGFSDPEEFQRGREMTVVGRVTGVEHGKVGEYDYAYPLVSAEAIYLWPKRPVVVRTPDMDLWRYGYGPWGMGPGWGPGWGSPYWGGPIIIRERPAPPPKPSK